MSGLESITVHNKQRLVFYICRNQKSITCVPRSAGDLFMSRSLFSPIFLQDLLLYAPNICLLNLANCRQHANGWFCVKSAVMS